MLSATGCPSGCENPPHDDDCPTSRPASDRDGHCCGPYALGDLRRGHGCPEHREAP